MINSRVENFVPRQPNITPLLMRQRPVANGKFAIYRANGFSAYIRVTVLTELRSYLQKALPDEAVGFLTGRAMRDNEGDYLVVTGCAMAEPEEVESSAGHVELSPQGTAQLKARILEGHPAAEIVGWWHTHPTYPPHFSSTDTNQQGRWSQHFHLGIVVSGLDTEETFGVYAGPRATRLKPTEHTSALLLQTKPKRRRPAKGKPKTAAAPLAPMPTSALVGVQVRTWTILISVLMAMVILGIGFLVWQNLRLQGELESLAKDWSQVPSMAADTLAPGVSPLQATPSPFVPQPAEPAGAHEFPIR
jgi:proteasome lid subunit RPN8/RPN11